MASSARPSYGDGPAFRSLLIALVGALVFAMLLRRQLLPDASAGVGLWVVFGTSLVMSMLGLALAWIDASHLRREWNALAALASSREKVLREHEQTVVWERVRLVQDACDIGRVRPGYREAWRADAASSTVVGAHARFIASTLLVLCVVGTFAGMKAALPSLTDAIANASTSATSATAAKLMSQALNEVAGAFGANFVALLGSLMLGATAYGASIERRQLLRTLERDSERRLYTTLPQDADASELQRAVDQLNQSVRAVREVGDSIGRLDAGLGDLKTTLRETLTEMHTAFSDSVHRHSVELQDQLNLTVAGLAATLGETSRALQLTAVSYEGLARGLEERDLGIRQATAALEAQATRAENTAVALGQCTALMGESATRLSGLTADTTKTLAEATGEVRQSAARIESALTGQAHALGTVQETLSGVRADLSAVTAHVGNRIEAVPDALRAVLISAVVPEVTGLRSDLRERVAGMREEFGASREELAQLRTAQREAREEAAAHASRTAGAVRDGATQITAAVQESSREASALLRQLALQSDNELQRLSVMTGALTARTEQSGRTGNRMVAVLEDVQKEIRDLRTDLVARAQSHAQVPEFLHGPAPAPGVAVPHSNAPGVPTVANAARNGTVRSQ